MNKKRGQLRALCFCSIVMCIMVLPSCAKRSAQKERSKIADAHELEQQRLLILDKVIQQEAMLSNVPIPLYDERILPTSLSVFEKETISLGYKSTLSVQQLIEFFMNQMERYGWKHIVTFDNEKIILLFENPDSYVCVTLQLLENYGSTIFVYTKRANF